MDTADVARTFAGIADTPRHFRHDRDMTADICGTSPTQFETDAWQTRNHELGMDRDDTGR